MQKIYVEPSGGRGRHSILALLNCIASWLQLSNTTLGFCVKPQLYERDTDRLRRVHLGATRMVNGLVCLPSKKRLKELVLVQLGEEMISWGAEEQPAGTCGEVIRKTSCRLLTAVIRW